MELPDSVAKMIREHLEIHGDPFEPWMSMSDQSRQEREWKCHGCSAIGWSKWPDWQRAMKHEPNCAWLEFRRAFDLPT